MKAIPLHGKKAHGRVALVDDEDYELVMRYRWWVQENTTPGHRAGPYARTDIGKGPQRTALFMHNLIAGPHPDHADGDGLNNQRSNLRPATARQNKMNTQKRERATSRYIGVSRGDKGKWQARITLEGRTRHLGTFSLEQDAARAYDTAACELFGEYARLNFPARTGHGGMAMEVTDTGNGFIGLRNIHEVRGRILRLTVSEWDELLARTLGGEFDRFGGGREDAPQCSLRAPFYGDTAAEIEQAALTGAQEVFGDGMELQVEPGYRVLFSHNTDRSEKYRAVVTVLVAPGGAA